MKLEDINKTNIHQVPDGYFEELPQIIQARVTHGKSHRQRLVVASLQYALPILLFLVVAIYWVLHTPTEPTVSAEELLAQVSTDEIINYLDESDITTDEILANVDLGSLDNIEFESSDTQLLEGVDLSDNDLDSYLEDFEIISDTL